MNPSDLVQPSWWRRLARRIRTAGAPRTNRLSHFEPLEPRTVLSGGPWDGGDFFRSPHDGFQDDPAVRAFDASAEFGYGFGHGRGDDFSRGPRPAFGPHDEFAFGEARFAPHEELVLREQLAPRPFDAGPNDAGPSPWESPFVPLTESFRHDELLVKDEPLFTPSAITTFPAATYTVEIIVVHDDDFIIDKGSSFNSWVALPSLPVTTGGSSYAIRFSEPVILNVNYSRAPSQANASLEGRYARLDSAALDAAATTFHEHTATANPGSSPSLMLNSAYGLDSSGDYEQLATSPDDYRVEDRVQQAQNAGQPRGGQDDGLVELHSAEVATQKRKLALAATTRPGSDERLQELGDLPVIHVSESLFLDLAVMLDAGVAPVAQPAGAAGDDGIIELLAADVGTMAARTIAAPAAPPQAAALEGQVATYQSFEVASIDDASPEAAVVNAAAAVAMAPTNKIVQAE